MLLLLCIVGVMASRAVSQDPIPPSFPFNAHVQGRVQCFEASVYCAGPLDAVMNGWFEFAANNSLRFYREDTTSSNAAIPYVREYVVNNLQFEYFLANTTSTSLQCVQFHAGPPGLVRNFLSTATYVGTETIRGVPAWTFLGTWVVFGQKQSFFSWVAIDSNAILGWNSTGVRYDYETLTALEAFPDWLYDQPDLSCPPAPHAQRLRKV